jgi:hypothetical protein
MKKATLVSQKRRGPPATGKGEPIVVRVQPPLMEALDGWIAKQAQPFPSRPEAMRRLVELALTIRPKRPTRACLARAARAKQLAAKAIDSLTVGAAAEEKAARKRRLIKGPEEFRDVRVDHGDNE